MEAAAAAVSVSQVEMVGKRCQTGLNWNTGRLVSVRLLADLVFINCPKIEPL